MNTTVFNLAQLQVLEMMSFVDSPEALAELKKAISDYFAKQAQKEIDRLWENGELNEEKVDKFYQLHERTPPKTILKNNNPTTIGEGRTGRPNL